VSDNESYRYGPDFAPTPNGTPYWRPNLPEDKKPKLGDIFDTFDDGYNMYKVYSEKGRFNNHDEENDGNTKRKRKTVSKVTNCPAKIGLKVIHGTECYKLFDFVENHNHPLMNKNNMDLSRAQRQLHFSDYIYIHYRDAHMIVDKMINRQLHVPEFSFENHVLHDELVSMFRADDTMKCNYAVFGDVVSFDATFRTNKYDFVFVPFTVHQKQPTLALTDQDAALRNVVVIMFPDSKHRLCMWHITQKLPGKVISILNLGKSFTNSFGMYILVQKFLKNSGIL
nr:hypothetical protein [Tanacetum cinerariifolium]